MHEDELAGDRDAIIADPWSYLAADRVDDLSAPGLADERADAWVDFWQVPGTHLQWVPLGPVRSALRTADAPAAHR